jgi:tetratricopeptide (TPR) repeat protein
VRSFMSELVSHHLAIQVDVSRYGFHDLVRTYAMELVESDPERDAATRRMLDHYLRSGYAAALHSYPSRDPLPLPEPQPGTTVAELADKEASNAWFSDEYQVMLAMVRFAAATQRYDDYAPKLSWTLEHFFDLRGLWRDWYELDGLALDAARRRADVLGQAIAHRSLSRVTTRMGDYAEALEHCGAALALFAELGDVNGQARTHVSFGLIALKQGLLEDAREHTLQSLTLFRQCGHVVGEGSALNNLGWIDAQRGDYDLAAGFCCEAIALQQKAGSRNSEGIAWNSLGFVHFKRGAFTEAVGCYERSIALYREDGDQTDEAEALESLGEVYIAGGDIAKARTALRRALAILREFDPAATARVQAQLDALA